MAGYDANGLRIRDIGRRNAEGEKSGGDKEVI